MDAFLAICQGLGLALAIGLLIGVVLPPITPAWGVIAGAAPLGVIACGAALNGADEAVWPAVPVGVLGAGLAAIVARDLAAGATRRTRAGSAPEAGMGQSPGVTAIVVLVAGCLALLSLLLPPIALLAAAALSWLAAARRRREDRKHEGLRVLR